MSGRHAQPLLVRRWRSLMLAAILLVLSGAVLLVWMRIDAEAHRADQLGAEASRRSGDVRTLAEDVRILRKQVRAEGGTPAAPDPSRAVDLPARVKDPVLVPGPRGRQGASGKPAPTLTPSPGPQGSPGAPGVPGSDSTASGPSGPPGASGQPGASGAPGRDGTDGKDGKDGTTSCPDGYSWQAPATDPDALVCRRVGAAPPPEQPAPDSSDTEPLAVGLDPQRRQYV
ncbi:collagen-like protein [Streptomyces sp. NBC_01016]|uniref:collagen-like protein n=1 Tax=Streptomyces sp. NBC_01016 TaxID=2903720 RepID=UPI00224EDAE7|nr:collagen-like protein [Streptomyces sp. NBC_01016]MCX4827198.1 collagen-like protein [Streptomyces sp. NBC_01016]